MILIIVAIFLIILYTLKSKKMEYFSEKPNIWLYWENKKGKTKPEYLNLCYDTIVKHCSNSFNIHLLDENSIHKFLPDIRKDLNEKLNIPQKTDYYRYRLLYYYGGIWIDSDTIVMKDLKEIIEKLDKYDFVGFGCHFKNCKNGGYPKPANWVMASRKNGILMKELIKETDKLLEKRKIKYHEMGRSMLWKTIAYLKKNKNWDYFHYDSKCLERDSNDRKLRNNISLSNENIDKNCLNKHLFVPIYNTAPGFPDWFINLNKKEVLNSDMHISKLFKKSLQ